MKRRGGGRGFWKQKAKWQRSSQHGDGGGSGAPKTDNMTQIDSASPGGGGGGSQARSSKGGGGSSTPDFDNSWRPFISMSHVTSGAFSRAKLQAATDYLHSRKDMSESLDDMVNTKRFMVDLGEVKRDLLWPQIDEDVDNHLEMVLGIFGIACTELASKTAAGGNGGPRPSFPAVRARVKKDSNGGRLSQLKDLKAHLLERVVDIRGTVIRVSNVRPLCTWLTFKCAKCGAMFSTEQPEGVYTEPKRCAGGGGGGENGGRDNKGCRSTSFVAMRSHSQTLTVDWQSVRIQETTPAAEKGRVPRTLDCVLTADLCDVAVPGDVIEVKGRLKTSQGATTTSFQAVATIHSYYLQAVSVYNQKVLDSNQRSPNCGVNFTLLDYSAIQEIHAFKAKLLKLLVASLCPSIYGNELVKAGLLLGLFGGTVKCSVSRDKVPVRGDPHILVVGDPGLGKSQMLSSCSSVAPRGVFVTATGATSSGLTVTLSREGNEFILEGGALVLADQGSCCIDEFDKMTGHQALLEAMEQQSISIAKSGIVCTLPARTAIIAAANPIGGHYNKAKTVAENLKLSPALLSRFDIIFIMIDKPDEEHDLFLSEHIMNRHSKNKMAATPSQQQYRVSQNSFLHQRAGTDPAVDQKLLDRLRCDSGESLDLIPHALMRKYIAYARQYVFPKITPECAAVIQNYYLELRRNYQSADCSPITVRQLESLMRLTEARARLELREDATADDARDVIEIVQSTFVDTFGDDLGVLDFSRAINGSGVSSRSKVKVFMSAVHKLAHAQSKNLFSGQELKSLMTAVGVQVGNFYDFMQNLSNQGYFIKKANGSFQLLSAEF